MLWEYKIFLPTIPYCPMHIVTVLSRIVAPSLIVPPPYFSTKKYVMIFQNLYLSHLKQHNFNNGTQNMQFYNVICLFPVVFTLFNPIYEFKLNVLVFLIMAHPQNLVLAHGVTIRDNTVFK